MTWSQDAFNTFVNVITQSDSAHGMPPCVWHTICYMQPPLIETYREGASESSPYALEKS